MYLQMTLVDDGDRVTGRILFKGSAAVEAAAREATLRGLAASGIEAQWDAEGEYIKGTINVPFEQVLQMIDFARSNLREGLRMERSFFRSPQRNAIIAFVVPDDRVGDLDGNWIPAV